MKFYDFQGSEYDAVIWAADKEDAIKKYKEEVCNEGHIECDVIDIDILREYMVKGYKSCIKNDDAENIINSYLKETLYNLISSDITQVVLLDSSFA